MKTVTSNQSTHFSLPCVVRNTYTRPCHKRLCIGDIFSKLLYINMYNVFIYLVITQNCRVVAYNAVHANKNQLNHNTRTKNNKIRIKHILYKNEINLDI